MLLILRQKTTKKTFRHSYQTHLMCNKLKESRCTSPQAKLVQILTNPSKSTKLRPLKHPQHCTCDNMMTHKYGHCYEPKQYVVVESIEEVKIIELTMIFAAQWVKVKVLLAWVHPSTASNPAVYLLTSSTPAQTKCQKDAPIIDNEFHNNKNPRQEVFCNCTTI